MQNVNVMLLVFSFLLVQKLTYSQLPVSQTQQKKNVLLEEYTGIYCGNCPSGHYLAEQVVQNHPDQVFIVSIHAWSFANPALFGGVDPDYRTEFGSPIVTLADPSGFPNASINRHLFPSFSSAGGTAMSRWVSGVYQWEVSSDSILVEDAYVNIAGETLIDTLTREMNVDVQAYFTDTGAPGSMRINVAVVQNNIVGPQLGGELNPGSFNPVDSTYNHQHMLRHLITGQWGDEIFTTSMGTLVDRTYSWTVPTHLNNVELKLEDLEVIVFISENQEEVINVAKAGKSYSVGVEDIDISSFTLYPNPATNTLNFNGVGTVEQVDFYSSSGSIIETIKQPSTNQIDVSHFDPGIYFVKFMTGSSVITEVLEIKR